MEVCDLFHSCRIGDIENVRYLIEDEVDVNVRDSWDSTPLYYACLCGHEGLVELLLSKGAKCEPNTFDGERCLYAALTDKIRKLLRDYKAITTECMRRDSYKEFLRRLLESPDFSDVCFVIHGEKVHAHRAVLCARSSYFADMLQTKWEGKSLIHLNHPLVKPWAFKAMLQFIYTDRLGIEACKALDCLLLAKQCKLFNLKQQLETWIQTIEMLGMSKPGTREIKAISIEPGSTSTALQDQYGELAELAIPPPFRQQQFPRQFAEFFFPFARSLPNDEFVPDDRPPYADICISVEGYRFYCHKMFLCGRSDYFKALFMDHFSEAVLPEVGSIPEVTLHDVTADVFAAVVSFIYLNTARLTEDILYNVLCAADMYLLNGLKRVCGNVISGHLDTVNALTVLRTARLFSLERLEMDCCEVIAANVDKFIDEPEFHRLIHEDAASIRDRQETDSIPVVDDLRFHLYNNILPNSSEHQLCMNSAETNLTLLNDLLVKLGLEC